MTTIYEQMADEFCRWPVPSEIQFGMVAGELLTLAEALAMFEQIVGPKIAELEAELKNDGIDSSCGGEADRFTEMEFDLDKARKALVELHIQFEQTGNELRATEAENARLRAAFEKPCDACDGKGWYAIGALDDPKQEQCANCYGTGNKPEGLE